MSKENYDIVENNNESVLVKGNDVNVDIRVNTENEDNMELNKENEKDIEMNQNDISGNVTINIIKEHQEENIVEQNTNNSIHTNTTNQTNTSIQTYTSNSQLDHDYLNKKRIRNPILEGSRSIEN